MEKKQMELTPEMINHFKTVMQAYRSRRYWWMPMHYQDVVFVIQDQREKFRETRRQVLASLTK